jgi:hypothetical protein
MTVFCVQYNGTVVNFGEFYRSYTAVLMSVIIDITESENSFGAWIWFRIRKAEPDLKSVRRANIKGRKRCQEIDNSA